MSLRAKIVLYLVLLHLVLGAIGAFVLAQNRLWLLAVEGLFAVSIAVGVLLVRALFVPLRLIRTGAELMAERDFTTRFREVGQPEMDALIRVYNDMAERLRQERLKLEEQHLLLDKILRVAPSGVIILDADGRIASLNPAATRLLSLPPERAVGRRPHELDEPGASGLTGLGEGQSTVLAAASGRRLRCTRGRFLDQGFARSFFLVEELTEELRASERAAYQKLIRMMSHEVKNSVGAVCSLLESCRAYGRELAEADRADLESATEIAIVRMRHLDAFMNGFAEVVRLPPPERRPCDLKRLVDDVLLLLRPELERRSIDAAWTAASAVAPISLDKNQIEQVLVNAMKNAMESIGEHGRIALTLAPDDGRVRLAIRDSGTGLDPAVRTELFTPFFSTKRDGRGLGLTVVREILTQHDCEFGLESAPGGGAEFWVRF